MENKTKALIKKGMLYGMIAFYILFKIFKYLNNSDVNSL